jgi:uncharacterized protein with ParB-like and HNH nuclease domain
MPIADYSQNHLSLAALLSGHSLRVPPYQRNFSWGDEEVLDFWTDIRDFHAELAVDRSKPGNYLFGTVVLAGRGDHFEIIDGQQRLTTATVFLSCIRDALSAMGSPYSKVIHDSYISLGDTCESTNAEFRLTLNDEDKDYFRRYVQEFPPAPLAERAKKSNGKLRRAREILSAEIADWIRSLPEDANKSQALRLFHDDIVKRFSFVVITTSDIDSAASIFEVLNDRGSKLTVADLLKNLLMTRAEKSTHREAVLKAWRQIDESKLAAEFVIRTSWASRHGDVKKRALYKEIKDWLKAHGGDSLRLARDLQDDCSRLVQIDEARTGNQVLDDLLKDLRDLGVRNHYPLMLAALNARPEYAQLFARACLALTIRYLIVCKGNKADFETAMLRAAATMHSESGPAVSLDILRAVSPSEDEFAVKFPDLGFEKSRIRARVLLRHFEMDLGTGELEPSRVRRNLHVEHIWPLKPKGHVSGRHKIMVHKIGNLTLVSKKINERILNGGFAKKRSEYKKSDIRMTHRLADYAGQHWKEPAVISRQRELGRQAAKLWPRELISDAELHKQLRRSGRPKMRLVDGKLMPAV